MTLPPHGCEVRSFGWPAALQVCCGFWLLTSAVQIFIGGLPLPATDEQLTEFASTIGEVCSLVA